MDFSGGNVVQVITGSGPENWSVNDNAMWATEDDYRAWSNNNGDDTPSNSNYDQRQSQSRSGSEPPNKKSKNSQDVTSSNRSKAIGKMFFKTKLCCKFRAGTCPYVTNCNFAHSIEELRRPPPNWQEIVAQHEEEKGVSSEPREEYQIPSLGSANFVGDSQRSYKGRHCKKFYTEEGCPYGDNCTFLHDEQSKNRESVAISLGPGGYGGAAASPVSGPNAKPSNWKTRICNKWELTGYCPFGSKCHFAHGAAEPILAPIISWRTTPFSVVIRTMPISSFPFQNGPAIHFHTCHHQLLGLHPCHNLCLCHTHSEVGSLGIQH
ncbi:zinc finger CCCH domain-containing protein 12 isoform X4 [Quercus suber]|uniref:zinc finger CCCH domain-containing protein 12 isoform X4 n=1 Tax=Quercus suber TaxID=58331 RepID=UPI0032DFA38E